MNTKIREAAGTTLLQFTVGCNLWVWALIPAQGNRGVWPEGEAAILSDSKRRFRQARWFMNALMGLELSDELARPIAPPGGTAPAGSGGQPQGRGRLNALPGLPPLLVTLLLAVTLGWGSRAQAQWNPTTEPMGAWAHSTQPSTYTYPPGHLYYPIDTAEFGDAVFQDYVLENTPSGFGPVYSDPAPKFHILSIYVYASAPITLPISFGGDDGSSLFVNGTFLGGHGIGDRLIYGGAWNDPGRPMVGIAIRQPGESFDRYYVNAALGKGSNLLILAGHNAINGFIWDIRVEQYGNPHRIKDDPGILAIAAEPLEATDLLADLADQLANLPAPGSITPEFRRHLLMKVQAAQDLLAGGHRNAEAMVLNSMKVLVQQVETQRGRKITDAAAAAFTKQVALIEVVLSE